MWGGLSVGTVGVGGVGCGGLHRFPSGYSGGGLGSSGGGGGHGGFEGPGQLSTDSKIFKLKYAQQPSNQFDGNKNGAIWRLSTTNYLCSRVEVVLEANVTKEAVSALGPHMDVDLAVIHHLSWVFFNMDRFNGLEDEFP